MEGEKGDGANPQATQYFHSTRKFASEEDCKMSEVEHEVRGQDASMENKCFDEPTRLKHKITKDLNQLKQLRASCSENPNQERVLDKMLASYEEAVTILNKFSSKEQDQGQVGLVSSRLPDDSDNSSMAASACMEPPKNSIVNSMAKRYKRLYLKKKERERSEKIIFRLSKGHNDAPDDRCAWRKYGQKPTSGAKHLRTYYKCTHRGCPARKQMQRSDEDPMIFEVMYRGDHICNKSPVDASSITYQNSPVEASDSRSECDTVDSSTHLSPSWLKKP